MSLYLFFNEWTVVTFVEEIVNIVKELEDVTINKLSSDVTFTCELNKPNVKVVWSKGKTAIADSEKYTISNIDCNYTLTIRSTEPVDESDYTISVKGKTSTAELFIDGMYLLGILTIALCYCNLLVPFTRKYH